MTTQVDDRFEIERKGGKMGVKKEIQYYAITPKMHNAVLAKHVREWVADCKEEWAADDGSLAGYCEVAVEAKAEHEQFFTLVAHHTMQYEDLGRIYGGRVDTA